MGLDHLRCVPLLDTSCNSAEQKSIHTMHRAHILRYGVGEGMVAYDVHVTNLHLFENNPFIFRGFRRTIIS
jgi:hypothetical protein